MGVKPNMLSKNNVLFFFVIFASLLLVFTGCSRKAEENSIVQLSIPNSSGLSKITEFTYSEPMSMQSISSQATDDENDPNWNASLNPANIGEVNCYVVMVSGNEPEMRMNSCVTTTGENLYVGRWVGAISQGGVLSLEVPSGPQREITVVGFNAAPGACTNFKIGRVKGLELSEPHILGKVVQDLAPGTVNVTIPVTVNASTLKIEECSGPAFDMENAILYFGDQTSGSVTISVDTSYSDVGNATNNLGGVSRKITNFDTTPASPNEGYTFLEYATIGGLSVGDEVMAIVQGANGTWTADNQVGPCGYRAWNGRYAFARVMATSSSPPGVYLSKGTFLDRLDYDPSLGVKDPTLASQITANLSASPYSNSTFCRLTLVKVLHYYDLNIASAITLEADPFDYISDGAGILPIRVSNNLTLASGAIIHANGHGYKSFIGKHGTGIKGSSGVSCVSNITDTGSGGSCSNNDSGAGGGGHGNASGDPFSFSGGDGGDAGSGGSLGGTGAGENCGDGSCFGSLRFKMFLGAAGGSHTSGGGQGGNGGGIVYLMANKITVPTSSTAYIESLGKPGDPSPTNSTGANGGGAGGSLMIGYKNLDLSTSGFLHLSILGGNGGTATGTGSAGGGGGGGGRVHVTNCTSSLDAISSITATGGVGGTSAAAFPGLNGLVGSSSTTTLTCP